MAAVETVSLLNDPAVRAMGVGDVFVSTWHGPPTAEVMRALGRAEERWLPGHQRIGTLTVLSPAMGWKLPEDARLEANKITEMHKDIVAVQATVLEEDGFRNALVRSVVSALEMASSTSYPSEVFKEVDKAAAWVADLLGGGEPLAHALQESIRSLRSSG